MAGFIHRWMCRVDSPETRESFTLAETWQHRKPGKTFNFWYTMKKMVSVYTFVPNEKYNKESDWTEELFRELIKDLRSPKPSVEVTRFAVNGSYVFKADATWPDDVPKIPLDKPKLSGVQRKQREIEIGQEPAPYLLYGKHRGCDTEFVWWLNPDKPKRQDIQVGDRVLVWTSKGFQEVTTTKIEKVDRRKKSQPKPTARVKKKL